MVFPVGSAYLSCFVCLIGVSQAWRWVQEPTTFSSSVNESISHGRVPFYGAAFVQMAKTGRFFLHGGASSIKEEKKPRSDASLLNLNNWQWEAARQSVGPARFAGGAVSACNDTRVVIWGGAGPHDDHEGADVTVVDVSPESKTLLHSHTYQPAIDVKVGRKPVGASLFGAIVLSPSSRKLVVDTSSAQRPQPAQVLEAKSNAWGTWLMTFGKASEHGAVVNEHWILWIPPDSQIDEKPSHDKSICDDTQIGLGVKKESKDTGGMGWESPTVTCEAPLDTDSESMRSGKQFCPVARFGHSVAVLPRIPEFQHATLNATLASESVFAVMYGGYDGNSLFSDAWLLQINGPAASGDGSDLSRLSRSHLIWQSLDAAHSSSLRQYGAASASFSGGPSGSTLTAAMASRQLVSTVQDWLLLGAFNSSQLAASQAWIPPANRPLFITIGGLHHEHGAGDAIDALDVDRQIWFDPAVQGTPPAGRLLPAVALIRASDGGTSACSVTPKTGLLDSNEQRTSAAAAASVTDDGNIMLDEGGDSQVQYCIAVIGGMRQSGKLTDPAQDGNIVTLLNGIGVSEGGRDDWVLVAVLAALGAGLLINGMAHAWQVLRDRPKRRKCCAWCCGCFPCCPHGTKHSTGVWLSLQCCLGALAAMARWLLWLSGCQEVAEAMQKTVDPAPKHHQHHRKHRTVSQTRPFGAESGAGQRRRLSAGGVARDK